MLSFRICHDNYSNKSIGEMFLIKYVIDFLQKYDYEHL